MQSLTKEELSQLSNDDLALRMDTILLNKEIENYGIEIIERHKVFHEQRSVVTILNTRLIKALDEKIQRKICYLTFNTLLQMQYTDFTAGASNHYVYRHTSTRTTNWGSPSTQIVNSALTQFSIISSRITMECFMQLVHFIDTGKEINNKSTFKAFKKWLNNENNPFSYFAWYTLRANHFDREYRTPEVHASSKLSSIVLQMKEPDNRESNKRMELHGIFLNLWQPLIEILNGKQCTSIFGQEGASDWLTTYLYGTGKDKDKFLESIFEQMK